MREILSNPFLVFLPVIFFTASISARMRSHGLVTVAVEQQQQPTQPVASAATATTVPPAEEGVDSVGPSLCMPNGKPVSPSALPPGPSRAALQKAILTQDTERLDFRFIFIFRDRRYEEAFGLEVVFVKLLFFFGRKKKLRFHPRQLYPAAKQGEVQRVLLMLSE